MTEKIQQWAIVQRVFHEVMTADAKARPALLDAQPADIRDQVAELVSFAEQPGHEDFLERPAIKGFLHHLKTDFL